MNCVNYDRYYNLLNLDNMWCIIKYIIKFYIIYTV